MTFRCELRSFYRPAYRGYAISQEEGGIDPHMLSDMGFGEYQPIASNDTEEGRDKNRRIEMVLLPSFK